MTPAPKEQSFAVTLAMLAGVAVFMWAVAIGGAVLFPGPAAGAAAAEVGGPR